MTHSGPGKAAPGGKPLSWRGTRTETSAGRPCILPDAIGRLWVFYLAIRGGQVPGAERVECGCVAADPLRPMCTEFLLFDAGRFPLCRGRRALVHAEDRPYGAKMGMSLVAGLPSAPPQGGTVGPSRSCVVGRPGRLRGGPGHRLAAVGEPTM